MLLIIFYLVNKCFFYYIIYVNILNLFVMVGKYVLKILGIIIIYWIYKYGYSNMNDI